MTSKEDVINYVMTTPNNPNRAVLEGMLDSVGGNEESDVFIIHADYDYRDETSVANVSATFQEVLEALNNNKILVLYYHQIPREYGNQFHVYQFESYYDYGESTSTSITFHCIRENYCNILEYHLDNTWTKRVVKYSVISEG